jgi:uncharacterized protein (TIGR03067 family)
MSDPIILVRGEKIIRDGTQMWSLKIAPSFTPKLVDMTALDKEVQGFGQTREAIYRIEGDTLLLCGSDKDGGRERPVSFETAGTEFITWHFTRVKR